MNWYVGQTAYKLIKASDKDQEKKEKDKGDTQKEKMQDLIV